MVPAPLARIMLRASIPRHNLQKPFYRTDEQDIMDLAAQYCTGYSYSDPCIHGTPRVWKVRSGEGLAILVPLSARESQQRAVQKRDFVKHAEKYSAGLLGARV